MTQIALPLRPDRLADAALLLGQSNGHVPAMLGNHAQWPFRTALLLGPPRSGKTSFGAQFAIQPGTLFLDDADRIGADSLFHSWNRAQAEGLSLLLASAAPPADWIARLPDLASRLASAQMIAIPQPDEAMMPALLAHWATRIGLVLPPSLIDYIALRMERSYAAAEAVILLLDQWSLERKIPVGQKLAREALDQLFPGIGPEHDQGHLPL